MPPGEALPEPVRSGQQTGAPSVAANAFALLRVLAAMRGPAGVTRLAAAVGIPKTTAHRLLEQLSAEGAVARHGLTPRTWSGSGRGVRRRQCGSGGEASARKWVGVRPKCRLNACEKAKGEP
ncbi:helix-turn-helix domain-containing protein [Streptomyces sp. NPDC059805]|uniref:helix-turn-helix domain-containing protein n=1 Tax=Streptomyces sp. NPDC059805 TaxID=3346954 RepID=UPI0036699D23